MNLHLSWDLFIFVFFGIVVAYSFIIGRNQTLKVISATYVAILSADALGNLFGKYFADSEAFLRLLRIFSVTNDDQATAFFKVLILIVMVVLVAVRGAYSFHYSDDRPVTVRLIISFILGLLSAGLMISSVLIFVSGSSLVSGSAAQVNPLLEIYNQSRLVRIMLDYSNFWFFLPGLGLVMVSLFSRNEAE